MFLFLSELWISGQPLKCIKLRDVRLIAIMIGDSVMHALKITKMDSAELKADLALHLCEGHLRELIARGAITEAALTRISHKFCDAKAILGKKVSCRKGLACVHRIHAFRQSVFRP
jgi:hypothetical protein